MRHQLTYRMVREGETRTSYIYRDRDGRLYGKHYIPRDQFNGDEPPLQLNLTIEWETDR